jgi:CheY-like chemotaxis protein
LVVDDDQACLQTVANMLAYAGATKLMLALSGSGAITKVLQAPIPPDCIICDLRMENGNGLQFLQEVRSGHLADHIAADTPFLGMTGVNIDEVREVADALEISALIRKPFNRAMLLDEIVRCLGHKAPADPVRYQAVAVPKVF